MSDVQKKKPLIQSLTQWLASALFGLLAFVSFDMGFYFSKLWLPLTSAVCVVSIVLMVTLLYRLTPQLWFKRILILFTGAALLLTYREWSLQSKCPSLSLTALEKSPSRYLKAVAQDFCQYSKESDSLKKRKLASFLPETLPGMLLWNQFSEKHPNLPEISQQRFSNRTRPKCQVQFLCAWEGFIADRFASRFEKGEAPTAIDSNAPTQPKTPRKPQATKSPSSDPNEDSDSLKALESELGIDQTDIDRD